MNVLLIIIDEPEEEAPQFNQDALDQLKMMGFGENRAKRALLEKGLFISFFHEFNKQ